MTTDNNVNTALGSVVRRRREELRMSQENLAYKSGFDRTYISGIERGRRNPSLKTLERLADALALDLETLSEITVTGRSSGVLRLRPGRL